MIFKRKDKRASFGLQHLSLGEILFMQILERFKAKNFNFTKNQMRVYKVFGPIVRQGKRVAAIFHLSTTTRAKQIESIVSRHCWNSFSHFIRFSLNWLKTCAKYFKMLQLAFILLFIFSSRNSHLLKLVWNSYVYLWQQNLSIVPTIFFTGAQFI